MNVAVMGCVVNGPGESSTPISASACPATATGIPAAPVFVDGKKTRTFAAARQADEFARIVDDYVERRYEKRTT